MHNSVISFLRNTFQDRLRRYLIISLVVLGIVLIVMSQQAAGPISKNPEQPPVIDGLEITKDRYDHCYLITDRGPKPLVGREQKYDIECIAYHPDGFELTYEWGCDGGQISAISEDGSMITWTAPDTSGDVTVTVMASDIAGNTVTGSIVLDVVSCSPCTFRGC